MENKSNFEQPNNLAMAQKVQGEVIESASNGGNSQGANKGLPYFLINNYGYTFELGGERYDARFWANCYGASLNYWIVHRVGEGSLDPDLKKQIENALNERE